MIKVNRKKCIGEFPKYELVTSDIEGESFESNFYEKIPITYLLILTGHTTERQILVHIDNTDAEKTKSTAKVFKT